MAEDRRPPARRPAESGRPQRPSSGRSGRPGARDRTDRGGRVPARDDDRRPPRKDEPELPDEVTASQLDKDVRRDLLSLDKTNAEAVARHLVMAGQLLDDDPALALAHARAARGRAGRVAVVREASGIAAYHAGEWAEAIAELRAARRMAGGPGLVAVLADCERALGRPERAIELARSAEGRSLTGDQADELRIVLAGARRDMGQVDAAVVTLQTPELDATRTGPAAARLFYAYADLLLAADRRKEAITWFLHAAEADLEGDTDAEERLTELGEPVPEVPDDVIDATDGAR
ncbi:tetratricopeptide repeat protein [Rhodococcus aerolatus]